MYKILLLEDSVESKDLVIKALGPSFEVRWATSIAAALNELNVGACDLILVDVTLPDGDGFRFYSLVLNNHKVKAIPVIFLSGNDSVSGKVLGLSLGAEDYIVKPFVAEELKARIEMRLKKYSARFDDMQILRKGDIEINLGAQRAFLFCNGKKVDLSLTPSELKLLILLSSNEDRVFSRNQLLDAIWGLEIYITDRSIDTHIYSLRKKLAGLSYYIQSIYGEGYRFSTAPSPKSKRVRHDKKN